nr:potassium/proton antiporter [Diaminobutyricibacter tongyongensis]
MVILVVAATVIVAVLSNRLSAWIRVPAPALFLAAAAAAAAVFPILGAVPAQVDERIVTVALIFILFDGGMHIGWRRFRSAAGAITVLGIVGTALTAAGVAVASHFLFGFAWQTALLIGTALSPTDPAVVFSILGKREITGRTGTILEGESGANDPVGIALMVSFLAATGTGVDAVLGAVGQFALQMVVGAVVGFAGGWGLMKLTRRVALPNGALYSVRAIACAALIYAVATILHGSGFLAVFLAGIVSGDGRAPYKREIERFSGGIASLAEIIVFVVLGLSVSLDDVFNPAILWTGLGISALLIFVIRPVFVGVLLLPIRLRWGERAFVLWAGLKGAVPILLGIFILTAGAARATTIYALIFIVVVVSVVFQGGFIPLMARLFRVPMWVVEPEPWASGLRFNEEPEGLHHHTVARGSPADGSTIEDLNLGDDGWVSMINREGRLLQVRGSTRLQAGDIVLTLAEPDAQLDRIFDASVDPY